MERTMTLNKRLGELEQNAGQNESEIRAIFEELRTSPITLAILQQTKVGLTVNRVRKLPGIGVETNQRAISLIGEWKDLAKRSMTNAAAMAAASPAAAAASAGVAAAAASPAKPASSSGAAEATLKRKGPDSLNAPTSDAAKKAKLSSGAALAAPAPPAAAAATAATPSPRSPLFASLKAPSPSVHSPSSSDGHGAARRSVSPMAPHPLSLSAIDQSPPPPTAPLLYNPNLAYYRSAASGAAKQAAAAAAQNTVVDHTSRKKTAGDSFMDNFHQPATPSSIVPVSLCSLETMCCDHIAANLDRGFFLDAIPVPTMLRALAKATPDQLIRYEKANPRLLGETESLWKTHCKRAYPAMRESDFGSATTWKQAFNDVGKAKNDRIAAMSQRLKAMQQTQAHAKTTAGVKTVNMSQAVKIAGQQLQAKPTPLGGAAQKGPGPFSKLKQEAQAVSNLKYAYKGR